MSKFRLSFVTNSSSSSYICEICGRHEEGWDISLSEIEMFECENGHIFCEDEAVETPNYKEYLEECLKDEADKLAKLSDMGEDELESMAYDYELRYYLPEKYCPICQFISYSEYDMARYLEKTKGISRDEVFAEVKKTNKRRKKLYDEEYIRYVCKQFNLMEDELVNDVKSKYNTYKDFKQFIRS
jgi:hypothetical protein